DQGGDPRRRSALGDGERGRRAGGRTAQQTRTWTREDTCRGLTAIEAKGIGNMLLSLRSSASYDLADETFVILMIEPPPHSRTHQVRQERLLTSPTLSCLLRHDIYGNPQRHILVAPGRFSVEFTAMIECVPNVAVASEAVEHPQQDIPAE